MQSRKTDITREKILDAAYGEIYRQGFQAASIANILATTGLTKGALYHHFPAKQDLGLAVIKEVIRDGMQAMIFDYLRDSDDPFTALMELIQAKAEQASPESVSLGCPLNNLMQEMSPLDEMFKNQLLQVLQTWQEVVADALLRAQRQGRVRQDLDCNALALFIVSAWEGCTGVAKNMQSVKNFHVCMHQLREFVRSLQAD
jgi:AcrR family transcriptional regulator